MAATFTQTVNLKNTVTGADTNEAATLAANVLENKTQAYTAGATSGKIDLATTDDATLGIGGSTTYDLGGGALEDLFGTASTYATVRNVLVINTGDTNSLSVAGDFFDLDADAIVVPAGGVFYWSGGDAGKAVAVVGDDHEITIASTSGTTYKIVITGVST